MSDEARPRRRWGRWLGVTAAVVVMVAVMASASRDRSLRSQLAAVIADLDATDPGWRLDEIVRDRLEIDADHDSGPRILAVAAAMPSGLPGKATKPLEGLPRNSPLDPVRRATLDLLLAGMPREAARDLIRFPRGRFELTVHDFEARTKGSLSAAMVAKLLSLDSHDQALAGRTDDALASVRASLNVCHALDTDPTMIGQLTHLGMVGIAFEAAERALALGEVSDAALVGLDQAVGTVSVSNGWTQVVRMERAREHAILSEIDQGRLDPVELGEWLGIPKLSLFVMGGPIARQEILRREHAPALRLLTRMVEATRQAPAEQFAAEAAIDAERRASSSLLVPTLYSNFAKHLAAARTCRCKVVALRALIAVERYRIRHGRWPDKVPEGCPPDPIDGASMRYRRTADGVVVYSIGNDRKDDGGDVGEGKPDVGYRLWDVDKRRAEP